MIYAGVNISRRHGSNIPGSPPRLKRSHAMTAKMTREVRAGDIITGTYKSRGGATYERRGMVVQVERGTPEKELAGNIIRWEVGPSGAPTTEVTESLPSSPTSSPVTKHRRSRKQDKEPTVVGDDMLIRVLKWQM